MKEQITLSQSDLEFILSEFYKKNRNETFESIEFLKHFSNYLPIRYAKEDIAFKLEENESIIAIIRFHRSA